MKLNDAAKRTLCLLSVVGLIASALCCTTVAYADDNSGVAYSEEDGVKTYYPNYVAAENAAYAGKTIVLTTDWVLDSTMIVDKSKSVTIEMNGHSISIADGKWTSVIKMGKNSSLTLLGKNDAQHEFSFKGYASLDDDGTDMTIKSGGLVTKGQDSCIVMDSDCKLTLNNVAIAGNADGRTGSAKGAGVFADGTDCKITMKNGATIAYNRTKSTGGGVFLEGKGCKVNMEASSIVNNSSGSYGGGIYSNGVSSEGNLTEINMTKGAKIDSNYASQSGGGVYFNYSYFKIESSDKTGSVSNNSVELKKGEDDKQDRKSVV